MISIPDRAVWLGDLIVRLAPLDSFQLSRRLAFYLLASLTVFFLAGSAAPTALYPIYQAAWGLTPVSITEIFAVYALAVLLALLVAGRVSDHIGRRPVLLVAAAAQLIAMVLYATASGFMGLMLARVVQGLTTGAALGAIGAAMIDLDKARGTLANAVTPAFGTATGAIMSGLFVQFLPAPTHFIYLFLGVIYLLQVAALAFMVEPLSRRAGVWQSLRPQLALPKTVREPLLLALPALIAVWSLAGFYGAIGPLLIRGMLGSHQPILGGLGLFILAAFGGLAVLILQHRDARQLLSFGAASIVVGVGTTLYSMQRGDSVIFFLSAAVTGVGFGAAFQGAVRSVVPLAAAHERAGVLSMVLIVCYLAMGVPAVIAGAMVARYGNILEVAHVFGVVIVALSAAAFIGGIINSARSWGSATR